MSAPDALVRALAQARADGQLGDIAPHFFSFGGIAAHRALGRGGGAAPDHARAGRRVPGRAARVDTLEDTPHFSGGIRGDAGRTLASFHVTKVFSWPCRIPAGPNVMASAEHDARPQRTKKTAMKYLLLIYARRAN